MVDDALKAQLPSLASRASEYAEAVRWMTGRLKEIPASLLPPVEGEEGYNVLSRIGRQALSVGPRALSIKRFGVIGDVNWGASTPAMDEKLRGVKLEQLAHRILERGLASGLFVGIASEDPDSREKSIRRLGGHVEPIFDTYDQDVVLGILQLQAEAGGTGQERYRLRVFDFEREAMLEWTGLTDLSRVDLARASVSDAPMPRYAIAEQGPDGFPLGEFTRALPLLKSEWASQVRGDRVEEATGFPQLKIKGEVEGVDKRGVTRLIELEADGDAAFLIPGDLSQMHAHHDRKLERIRDDLLLPGGALGGQTPSGEALREANQKFIASCKAYAVLLSGLLTELVADLAALEPELGKPPEITVDINREYEKAERLQMILDLKAAGLIERGAAVRAISVYVPTWSDDKVEQFIAEAGPQTFPQPSPSE